MSRRSWWDSKMHEVTTEGIHGIFSRVASAGLLSRECRQWPLYQNICRDPFCLPIPGSLKFEVWEPVWSSAKFPNQRGRGRKREDSFVGGKNRCAHMHVCKHKHPLLMLARSRALIWANGAVSAHDAHANGAASTCSTCMSGALSAHDTHVSRAVHASAHQPATHSGPVADRPQTGSGPFLFWEIKNY